MESVQELHSTFIIALWLSLLFLPPFWQLFEYLIFKEATIRLEKSLFVSTLPITLKVTMKSRVICQSSSQDCANTILAAPGCLLFHFYYILCIDNHQYICLCCFQELNECDPNPCLNNGTCVDGVRNYTCNCASFTEDGVLNYYTGRNCSTSENA